MRIPERVKNRNFWAGLVFVAVVLAAGWRWAEENGYLAFSEPAPLLVKETPSRKPAPETGRQKAETPTPNIRTASSPNPVGLGEAFGPERQKTVPVTPASANQAHESSSVPLPVVSSATHSELMELQADILLLKAKVEKEKLLAQLDELQAGLKASPSVPAVPVLTPAMLEALTPPPDSASTAPPVQPVTARPRLVGIQGSEQKISATVSTTSGQEVTLAAGDAFQGSKVSAIDKNGVRLANGKRIGWE